MKKSLTISQIKNIALSIVLLLIAALIISRAISERDKIQEPTPTHQDVKLKKKEIDEKLKTITIDSVANLPDAIRELNW